MKSSHPAGSIVQSMHGKDLLINATWESWTEVQAPYSKVDYETQEVTTRFHRNGYDWDVHGTLLTPERETMPGVAFVMTHGGASSEYELLETPDGRPGVAAIVASQGFPVLVVTWVGHHHPSGRWQAPVAERWPIYLFDRELPVEEVTERMLRCTYNVTVDGIAQLADQHLADRKLLVFGHSTSGPMSVSLQRFLRKSTIAGIFGWGSGGPDGWFLEWLRWVGVKKENIVPIDHVARRTINSFRKQGYEGESELCPWGGAEEFMRWSDEFRSQLKTSVCENQHKANIPILREYAQLTGLPEAEFIDHLYDPDADWLAKTPTLLMVGERDVNHWFYGEGEEEKLEVFMGRKFEQRTPWTKVVFVPRYSHYGYVELYNEKIAYLWLWAVAEGFFEPGLKS
jgi:pimeloyl-ACP methyl ester carboxylesterase